MKSITMKLLLPDSTHSLIIERAKVEGVDLAHYCSSLITEFLGNESRRMSPRLPIEPHHSSTNGIAMGRELPDTVEQIFEICCFVWQEKMEFADAVRKVAKNWGVNETTVRDKCTRRISLPDAPVVTNQFVEMLARPIALRDYLCHRFPKCSGEISHRFEKIMPRTAN